ncbi:hypothetical protein MIMGU_mgv1a000089mg [Erythranthe guttata]|uniref:HhH-GPD domain-containing protein n=1 Tax=Erythranthe guttata TaxID=4155 RepID=A0A022R635_ERYGU|nr:hypothetical protein MIMGU_mgv1a000089mg [Erythranthe guttata]
MAVRSEEESSELKDVQIGCSWIPTTPAKPNSTNQQPICGEWLENHLARPNSTNLSESEMLNGESLQTQSQTSAACYNSPAHVSRDEAVKSHLSSDYLSEFDTWQASKSTSSHVYVDNARAYDKFPVNDMDKWPAMSFSNLLALADSAGNKGPAHNVPATSTYASTPLFHPEIEDGSSAASRPSFNLNSPPRSNTNIAALSKSASSRFAPITPGKNSKAEHRQDSNFIDLSVDELPAGKNSQENKTTMCGGMELRKKKEKSHLVVEQLCEDDNTSTQLQENHKPDKEGTEEADMIKTPPPKARKKKHRPKVIIEGKKQRTPKSSAVKPSVQQETPSGVKRKYVRRKADDNPIEGDSNKKSPGLANTNTPGEKRKYERKKRTNKPEGDDDMHCKETAETAEINVPRYTRSSCRRSLNFNSDTQARDESSSYCPPSNCNSDSQAENFDAKDQSRNGMEKNDVDTSQLHTHSINQLHEDYLSRPEQHSPMFTDQTVSTRGKCQIIFSDVTHDKEVNTVPVRMNNPDSRITQMSQSDSICSSTCLTPERRVGGLKRRGTGADAEAELYNRNDNGAFYNSLQAYLPAYSQNAHNTYGSPGFQFPAIYKKKRTEKVYNMVSSCSQQYTASTSDNNNLKHERNDVRFSCTELFASITNQGSSGAQFQVANFAADATQNGRQIFEDLLALGPTERIKRRRSKGVTRLRDLSSLLKICQELPSSSSREATTCMEALVADTCSKTAKKKRSKRSMIMNSAQNSYSHQSMGPPLALTWKCMSPVDSLIDQLDRLDLNAERCRPSGQEQNPFMAYHRDYQLQHALVPFRRYGDVVPYDSSFDQVKRRRPRPKVELDDETSRVWKLLLENINSEGIDGTDEEKTKWWEEERRVFNGRADSFIARMHLVQGDRRFSPWKGSVVDSVVGVFLTQNVSDHLSSSAFMSLAARFPLETDTQHEEFHEEGLGTEMKEPEVCELDSHGDFGSNKDILKESVSGEVTEMLQDFKDDSVREVDSGNSVGNSFDGIVLKDNFRSQSTDTCKDCPVMSHETVANETASLVEEGKDAVEDTLSSQNSVDSPIAQNAERSNSCLLSTAEEEPIAGVTADRFTSSTPFVKLLQMAGTVLQGDYEKGSDKKRSDETRQIQLESLTLNFQSTRHLDTPTFPSNTDASCSKSTMSDLLSEFELSQKNSQLFSSSGGKEICAAEISEFSSESASGTTFRNISAVSFNEGPTIPSPNAHSSNNDQVPKQILLQENTCKMQEVSKTRIHAQNLMDVTGSTSNIDYSKNSESREVSSNKNNTGKMVNGHKARAGRPKKEKENQVEWDLLRKQAQVDGKETERTANRMDSVDWDAVRCADVNDIAQTIKERGMNNMLAERIKEFLNRIVRDHGSIDLEWLRDVPPDKAKEYLLSFRGLGLKSVECVRLLTLHHLAFPVDTNVGRIAVRLGWVPLQPLPESLQLHLLEMYPVLESIQKYLWPRLCKLDQRTLYELHYQMITFGKVFCTKSKPNCNACPMRGECRHFASAFASARLALPAPEEKSIVGAVVNRTADQNPTSSRNTLELLPSPPSNQTVAESGVSNSQPIIEEPASPEPEYPEVLESDIENAFNEDPDEIPTIRLNMEQFTHNLQKIMEQNTQLDEGDMSKALVALTSEAASIPVPKLKNMSRLRTEHQVYELPDSHPLLEEMDKREPDDPSPYLLAIWTPGETMNSIDPPERRCISEGFDKLCTDETCSACNSIREANSQTVRGTLLIPCRTAMRGSFPLNGTYFQVNEVFSDHESSLSPMNIPRQWLWNLPRRTVYFGTSIPTIFKGLSTEGIQYCFWRGFVCVRGFDRKSRAPRPLIARLHFPASSRLGKGKGKVDEKDN